MDKVRKEIQERARQLYGTFVNGKCIAYDEHSEQAYIKGAKEQDPISYLRGRNDALKEMVEVIEQNKKEMIEKACEWLEKYADMYASDYGMCNDFIYDFRRDMEE